MASLRDQQAERDFASFDDDRKEGRYAPGHFATAAVDAEPLADWVDVDAINARLAIVDAALRGRPVAKPLKVAA